MKNEQVGQSRSCFWGEGTLDNIAVSMAGAFFEHTSGWGLDGSHSTQQLMISTLRNVKSPRKLIGISPV